MADFTKKLVDQSALEALAQGLNKKAKDAVAAEKTRAEAAEKEAKDAATAAKTAADGAQSTADEAKSTADQAAADLVTVKQDIAGINSAEGGVVKQAKDYTDQEVKLVKDVIGKAAVGEEPGTGLTGRIETAEADIAGLETANQDEERRIAALETKVGEAKVEGDSPKEATGLFAEVDRLDARINGLSIPSVDGLASTEYVDNKISNLVGGADEAFDTLKELQDKLKGNDDAVGALTTQIAEKADKNHNHDDVYAKLDHNHDEVYAAKEHTHSTADVAYTNEQYPGMTTVADALDQLLYVTPAVSTFTSNPPFGDYEIGDTVSNPRFTWSYNKAIVNQNLKAGGSVLPLDDQQAREYAHTGDITSNTTFTISGSDNKAKSCSRTGSFNFKHKRYFGVAEVPAEYNSDFILGLSGKEFCTGRDKSAFKLTAGAGQYMFYCFPATYGTPTFNVGGFDGGFELAATIDFTNASGNTTSFVIWKSENANLGTQSIIVK